jgi:acyl carrier protein
MRPHKTPLIPDERVAEVVRILTTLPHGSDSLDIVELMMDLEEEFGAETVKLAVRFTEAMSAEADPPPSE